MNAADVIILLGGSPQARGVHAQRTDAERAVPCTVKSVGMRETYEAMANGLHPEYVFEIAYEFDYLGEKRLRFLGDEYRVIRTYVTKGGGREIVAERAEVTA